MAQVSIGGRTQKAVELMAQGGSCAYVVAHVCWEYRLTAHLRTFEMVTKKLAGDFMQVGSESSCPQYPRVSLVKATAVT